MMAKTDYDFVIIGGGFYGCCLALLMRSISNRVLVVEQGNEILDRASRVNQARIHTGFHYPRSFLTALRSMQLHQKFADDFPEAVVDDFDMLYAIARRRSKVTGTRFYKMFENMGAPISPAGKKETALFSGDLVEQVFNTKEWAFDYSILRAKLYERMRKSKIELKLNTTVEHLESRGDHVGIHFSEGPSVSSGTAFNVTYSMINQILKASNLTPVEIKYEFVELALASPPDELQKYGVTVMDGPFFSFMPFPSENLHSLSHVRYTPHYSWLDKNIEGSPYELAEQLPRLSNWRHMMADAQRYMPLLKDISWKHSIFDVKAILSNEEKNDGRPILFHQQEGHPNIISIMGGKIDNIYDLFSILPDSNPKWADVNFSYLSE